MKVLIVSAADQGGGAFIAARRLHFALRRQGVESFMLVAKKTLDDPAIIGPASNATSTWADIRHYLSLPFHRLHRTDNPYLHSFAVVPSSLHNVINTMDVDVVNLHWVNREMMSIADIGKINKPIVWTLHDMWPLLGAAHHDFLPLPGDAIPKPGGGCINLDGWMYWRKKKFLAGKNIAFVGPSRWMTEKVVSSRIFAGARVQAIVNPLDTGIFRLHQRESVRKLLGLDPQKKYVLFGAIGGTSDPQKGFKYLRDALQVFSEWQQPDVELLVFGGGFDTGTAVKDISYPVHALGRFSDEISLALLYNAADVFVTSSLLENLPNTVAESLCCGTPVVAFEGVGGIGEMVQHESNGFLAENRNARSLAEGIVWALSKADDDAFRQAVRDRAAAQFAEEKVAREYVQFLASVL